MKVRDIIRETEWYPSPLYGQDRPRLSVLLPTFRRGASGLFVKAARSVLDQELRELELIVVDDGSTDGTADHIAQLMREDPRVSCLRHPRNVGLPAISEYEAFRKARADHLAFAFDDDEFYPSALGELLDHAERQHAAFVHGYVELVFIDEAGQSQRLSDFGKGPVAQATLRSHNYFSNNAVLLHRRVLETVGLYDPHVCMARLCDWDLWRRIAEHFDLVAVDVAVGRVLGPSTKDSLGSTYLMEPWLSLEWMNTSRNPSLGPERFEDYDVLAVPSSLSRESRLAIEELRTQFRSRSWFPIAALPSDARPDGHILVVVASLDASTTLNFDQLPDFHHQRVRLIHYGAWQGGLPEEMIGASAIVFVRALFDFPWWIENARRLGIPHYYSSDDNLMLLAQEDEYAVEYVSYTHANVREMLSSFSGVLLSTRALVKYWEEHGLHDRLYYYPPVARIPVDCERVRPRRDAGVVRVGFFGGAHRQQAFLSDVLPAIRAVSDRHRVELVVMGVPSGSFEADGMGVVQLEYERTHDLALRRMMAQGIDILVHPNSATANNRYKTLQVLINARALGAAPVLSNEQPYDVLADDGSIPLCDHDPASWERAIERLVSCPDVRARALAAAERYCEAHYSGRQNAAPGLLLRDVRYRKAMAIYKLDCDRRARQPTHAPAHVDFPNAVPVPVFRSISYRIKPDVARLSEIGTLIATMGFPIAGEVRLEIRDSESGDLLRQPTVRIKNLAQWSSYVFEFEKLEASGRELSLRFVADTNGTIAVFETSNHCRSLWRRLLRKGRLDRSGRDLFYRVR